MFNGMDPEIPALSLSRRHFGDRETAKPSSHEGHAAVEDEEQCLSPEIWHSKPQGKSYQCLCVSKQMIERLGCGPTL